MQYYATPVHMLAPEAPPFIPFSNLNDRAGLVSLEDARCNPSIVYGAFERLSRQSLPPSVPVSPASSRASSPAGTPTNCTRDAPSERLDEAKFKGSNIGFIGFRGDEHQRNRGCREGNKVESSRGEGSPYQEVRDNWF